MKISLTFILALFLLTACSTVDVQTEGNVPSNLAEVKATYGWLENANPSDDIRVNNPGVDKLVRNSVDKHLSAMGYVRVEPDQAEYLLTWFGKITEDVKDISLSSYYSRSGYTGMIGTMPKNVADGKVKKVFARGTLVLDVLDINTKKVLWRGSATNTFQDQMSESRRESYIDTSVQKILEELPGR